MMPDDPALMEASLIAVADSGIDIRLALFERFFAAYPDRRATFYNVDAASRRMTDETIQMMFGLASDEAWVWPLVTELTFTHRNYGNLPLDEYDVFIDLTIDALRLAAGDGWPAECDAVWQRHGDRLKVMIATAKTEWTQVMPGVPCKISIA
jgi:hypothetical protein